MAELIQIRPSTNAQDREGLVLASKGAARPACAAEAAPARQRPGDLARFTPARTPIAIPRAPGETAPLDAERVTLIRARTRAARRDERRREFRAGLCVVALIGCYVALVVVALYAAGARFGIW
jgi:hypothetical protein